MLFLLVFKAKHNLRVTGSKVYKVFKQLQSQPQSQHTVLGSRILRKLSINVLVVLHLTPLYGNRAGSREFELIQHGRTRLRSGQFALIILTFKQFSELYFMPAESD